MEEESTTTLQSMFEGIEDPRVERTKQYKLLDIILITILRVLCGADGWVEIESFGKTKETCVFCYHLLYSRRTNRRRERADALE